MNWKELAYDLKRLIVIIANCPPIYIYKECKSHRRFTRKHYKYTMSDERSLLATLKLVTIRWTQWVEADRKTAAKITANKFKGSYKTVDDTIYVEESKAERLDKLFSDCEKAEFTAQTITFKAKDAKDKDVFSMFGGWRWRMVDKVNYELIMPWLDHIDNCIANHNLELAEKIKNWIAYPLQNPGARNNQALFIYCNKGAGKTMFTDMVCDLFAGYSTQDIDRKSVV